MSKLRSVCVGRSILSAAVNNLKKPKESQSFWIFLLFLCMCKSEILKSKHVFYFPISCGVFLCNTIDRCVCAHFDDFNSLVIKLHLYM